MLIDLISINFSLSPDDQLFLLPPKRRQPQGTIAICLPLTESPFSALQALEKLGQVP